MNSSRVLSIDAMGGDGGPAPVLAGLMRVLRHQPDLRFLVFGPEDVLSPLVARRPQLAKACTVRHAPDVVEMTTQPSRALREGRNSSMWHALQAVRDGEAGVAVSAGNTGALMAMSVLCLRKAPGVARPAIAVHWPCTAAQGFNVVLDVGADVRADAQNLLQYAVMGAEYARVSLGIATPRVGLLNLGTEPTKGPEELRAGGRLISAAADTWGGSFSYIGFVEGADISGTRADVIVTDGFTGNVALKTAEGTASMIRLALREAFNSTLLSRIAGLFAISALKRLGKRFDPRRVNGGVFLGLNGAVVKSHGGADAVGFAAAVRLAAQMAETDFPAQVAAQLGRIGPTAPRIADPNDAGPHDAGPDEAGA